VPEKDSKDQWGWSCEKRCVTFSQGRKEYQAYIRRRKANWFVHLAQEVSSKIRYRRKDRAI